MRPGILDHWQTLYPLDQLAGSKQMYFLTFSKLETFFF